MASAINIRDNAPPPGVGEANGELLDIDLDSKISGNNDEPTSVADKASGGDDERGKDDKSQRKSKLGRKILAAMTSLKAQAEEIYDYSSDELAKDLGEQIVGLNSLGKRFIKDAKR